MSGPQGHRDHTGDASRLPYSLGSRDDRREAYLAMLELGLVPIIGTDAYREDA